MSSWPAAEAKEKPAAEAKPTAAGKEEGEKKKKKGWKEKMGEAVGSAFGKKKPKDEV